MITKTKLYLIIAVPLAVFLCSLFLGRYPISPWNVIQVLFHKMLPIQQTWPNALETVIFEVRLPRILLAMLIGGGLSISGASFQGMFQNPLVGPGILGVSAAAGFGAALAILLSPSPVVVQFSAFVFGLFGVFLTYTTSRIFKTTPILMLVLSGIVVGAFFSALISLIKYVADPYEKLPAITYWLMGSLGGATLGKLLSAIPPMFFGITGLILLSWRMNLLSMGDETARSLGMRTERIKGLIIICATIITASSVCISGIIGWVGLIIPHVCRMLVGPNHRVLLPTSLVIGAAYLLIVDDLSRTLSTAEIPLGILTALIGAPFFIYLIRKQKREWA